MPGAAARSLATADARGLGAAVHAACGARAWSRDTGAGRSGRCRRFSAALLEYDRPLPPGFVITLPKVTSVAQVSAMAVLCERLDEAFGIGPPRRLAFEIQVETPQAILGADGAATIAQCVHAGPAG